jgi:hypothetical protein
MRMSPSILIVWYFTAKAWICTGPLVGIIGTLIGVFVGSWLSHSGQRKQSLQDNKRAEYRELINFLRVCVHDLTKKSRSNGTEVGGLNSGDEILDVDGPEARGYNMISDRFFIDDVMDRENVRKRWQAVFNQQSDSRKLWAEWSTFYNALMKMARSDLKGKW